MSLYAWIICCSPYTNLLAIKAAILNPHLHFRLNPCQILFLDWSTYQRQRHDLKNKKDKTPTGSSGLWCSWFSFQISFHSLFPFFISSISRSVFFTGSDIFTPAVLLTGCVLQSALRINVCKWLYSICTTMKLSSTLVNASVKHFYHFMWILHVPFRACFNVLTCWWQCPSSYPHDWITSWKYTEEKGCLFCETPTNLPERHVELDWWAACSRQNEQKWNRNNLLPFPILQAMSFIAFSLHFWTLEISDEKISDGLRLVAGPVCCAWLNGL